MIDAGKLAGLRLRERRRRQRRIPKAVQQQDHDTKYAANFTAAADDLRGSRFEDLRLLLRRA